MTATSVLEVLMPELPDLTLWKPDASAEVSSPCPEIWMHMPEEHGCLTRSHRDTTGTSGHRVTDCPPSGPAAPTLPGWAPVRPCPSEPGLISGSRR